MTTIDSWLFKELNLGIIKADKSKVDTLGHYAKAFREIIDVAAMDRKDITATKKLLEETGTTLYRGTGLTQQELHTYQALVGKVVRDYDGKLKGKLTAGYMALTGFTSTSMKRPAAESFAWSNEDSGHQATLFQIIWKTNGGYFLMDMSAFPDEEEVLLFDGTRFEVVSVQSDVKNGKPFHVIVLKCDFYGCKV